MSLESRTQLHEKYRMNQDQDVSTLFVCSASVAADNDVPRDSSRKLSWGEVDVLLIIIILKLIS